MVCIWDGPGHSKAMAGINLIEELTGKSDPQCQWMHTMSTNLGYQHVVGVFMHTATAGLTSCVGRFGRPMGP